MALLAHSLMVKIRMISKFLKSVKYAFQGFCLGVKEERNIRIDLVAIIFVTRFAMFYNFSKTQWAILTVVLFIVPSLELMNTAVERAVAKPDQVHDKYAGQAKDAAAAGVFFMALGSVIIAVLLFWDIEVITQIIGYYTLNVIRPLILVVAIIMAYLFIIKDKFEGKK